MRVLLFVSLLGVVSISHGFVAPQAARNGVVARKNPSLTPPPLSTSSYWTTTPLYMADDSSADKKLPMLLDPGTKGGALFLSLVLFVVPILFYQVCTNLLGFDELEAGKWIGVGFTVITTVLWVGSYIFRVATKDMTYAKQLKDYENAVIAKRLEELDEDEVQALVEDIERDTF